VSIRNEKPTINKKSLNTFALQHQKFKFDFIPSPLLIERDKKIKMNWKSKQQIAEV